MQNANQESNVNINGNVSVGKDLVGHDKIEVHLHGADDSGRNKTHAVCPNCGTNEQTQKVSVIYSSGTPLAQKFTPPWKPSAPVYPIKFYIGILMAIGCGIWFLLLSSVAFTHEEGSDLFVFMAWALPLSILGFITAKKSYEVKKRQDEEYPNKLSEWENQKNLWNNLYFCHKDGTVFDAKTQSFNK